MTCLVPHVFAGPATFAVGPDAISIRQQQHQITFHALDTPGTGALALSRITPLLEASERASRFDWDGHGARAANADSIRHAARFLASLPSSHPTPDVGVDPDGDISFEWYASPELLFSISIAPGGELHYAGRFGKSRVRGKEAVASSASSSILRSYIKRVSESF